jgi:hypothetical protein
VQTVPHIEIKIDIVLMRLIINATELFASEWTAVTIGELHLTLSNLNKSVWRHSQIQNPKV